MHPVCFGCIISLSPQAIANRNLAPPLGSLYNGVEVERLFQLYVIPGRPAIQFQALGVKQVGKYLEIKKI